MQTIRYRRATVLAAAILLSALLHDAPTSAADGCPVPGFALAVNYKTGNGCWSVAVGDFNGDGKPDLATANRNSRNISVLLGNGDGTFQTAISYGDGSYYESIAVGDFNGDGKPDLAVGNGSFGNISVLLGIGDGTFQAPVTDVGGTHPGPLAVADFNRDGKLDLAVANIGSGDISVLLNDTNGGFLTALNSTLGVPAEVLPRWVAVGDFNGDGKPDLAVANERSGNVSVLLNTCVSTVVHLEMARSNAALIVSWPLLAADYVLESATSLNSTHWQGVTTVLTTNNGRCEVTMPLDQTQCFFHLRGP